VDPATQAQGLRPARDLHDPSRAAGRTEWVTLMAVAFAVLAADQLTKAVLRAQIPLGDRVEGYGGFDIHHVRNSGIVHGLFQGTAFPLAIVTAIVVFGMLAYFARTGRSKPGMPVAFGFLVGGSLGNLADRIRLGYVTDFVDSPSGGSFNLADVSIMVGIVILLVVVLLGEATAEPR
jgi:signal peptidase II